jgi:hypothetical protein
VEAESKRERYLCHWEGRKEVQSDTIAFSGTASGRTTAMSSPTPTNMTLGEMIPDTENPEHDAHYWCLPPIREVEGGEEGGRYPMYLVTQGRKVGVWRSW